MHLYHHLAEIYDQLMEHVNYTYWAEYIQTILHTFYPDKPFDRILDCSCGTAAFFNHWYPNSEQSLVASDLSGTMLQSARRKNSLLPLIQADMKRLPFSAGFGLILCLYDSFNYLLTPDEILNFFYSVSQSLIPGGVLIFDVTTATNCQRYFHNEQSTSQIQSLVCHRISRYDTQTMTQYNHFTIHHSDEIVQETHIQKIYTIHHINELIQNSPLIPVQALADFSFKSGTEKSERIHFILEKPYPSPQSQNK